MKKKLSIVAIIILILVIIMSSCSSAPESYAKEETPKPEESQTPATEGSYEEENIEDEEYSFGETYKTIDDNKEKSVAEDSVLTFSLKVDTASYSNVQRYIDSGSLPPVDAVRVEEMLNYFSYDMDMKFEKDHPFAVYTEVGRSPYNKDKYLAFTRISSKKIDKEKLPKSNLVFLIDTSGSMDYHDRLPLLQESFKLLVENLKEEDRISIVTYSGHSEILLDSASGADKERINKAIDSLSAGGSTAGEEGIETAYKLAEKNFTSSGNNRVIIATDGDFNVGVSDPTELSRLISEKRDTKIYLSILGFGMGNTRDDMMETLSKDGNGNYSYINNLATAQKVLVDELESNLFVIAKDVKAQVEFNPKNVKSYRLIGYENRLLEKEDFEDDKKDAGEVGLNTDIIMLYEIELGESASDLKYQKEKSDGTEFGDELFEVRIRYQKPNEEKSLLMVNSVVFEDILKTNSTDFNFATSVAGYGQLLRNSEYIEDLTFDDIMSLGEANLAKDEKGYRREYINLLKNTKNLLG